MEPKDEIKERADIAEVIGEHLQLKPAGSGSFKALCPFHGEKTPSFYVSREKQIWHCFGCDKGGDVFAWLMEMEGLSFPEAMKHLGKKYGVEVPDYTPKNQSNEKDFLLDMHDLAGRYFEKILHDHDEGKIARDYIAARGIDVQLAKKFRLGYAPDRWDALTSFFKSRGFTEDRIIKAGLAKRKSAGNGLIDKFRGRLMVPLCDARGSIVGFTGRLLKEDDAKAGPKYLNSPETPIYHKSEILFGLDLARAAIRQEKSIIIVEGNLDVVASHKAGIENVVASSGTALTELQLRQLKKLSNKIIFSFDADAAGFTAAQRGIKLAQSLGLDVEVISIPKDMGKDPDDVVQKSPENWSKLAKNPVRIMDYYFEKATQSFDVTSVDGKRGYARFITTEISRLQDPVEQEHWLQKLGDIIHVEISVLREVTKKNAQDMPEHKNQTSVQTKQATEPKRTSIIDQASAFIVGLVLYNDEYTEDVFAKFDPKQLPEEPWARVYKNALMLYTQFKSSDSTQKTLFSRLCDQFEQSDAAEDVNIIHASVLRAEQIVAELSRDQVRDELNRHVEILARATAEAKRKQLEAAIRQAEQSGDSERLRALIEQYTKLL
ncbi:MAG: DNA primase [Patescibacteria group bacterium]